jgi:hypothetical protein
MDVGAQCIAPAWGADQSHGRNALRPYVLPHCASLKCIDRKGHPIRDSQSHEGGLLDDRKGHPIGINLSPG